MYPGHWIPVDLPAERVAFYPRLGEATARDNFGRPDCTGVDTTLKASIARHILGAFGECLLAWWLSVPWEGALGDRNAVDVAGYLSVRTVDKGAHRLIAHQKVRRDHAAWHFRPDPEHRPIISVLKVRPNFGFLRGWGYGFDVFEEGRYETHRFPAWYLENERLRWMEWLPTPNELGKAGYLYVGTGKELRPVTRTEYYEAEARSLSDDHRAIFPGLAGYDASAKNLPLR